MTSLLNYLDNPSCNSASDVSSSLENSNLSHDSKPSTKFIIQPPSDAQNKTNVLSKRLNTAELGDLLTKKVKTKSTNVSNNSSLEHSPLSKRNLNLNENTTSKTLATDEDRSMALEESDDDASTVRNCGKTQILIPPFEADSLSGESTADSTRSLSKQFSTELARSNTDFSLFGDLSDQESAAQLSNALEVLKLRLMAHDEERLRDSLIKILFAQEPVSIPAFAEMNSEVEAAAANKVEKPAVKKVETEFDIMYGEVEFPFLSLSVPYEESQSNAKSDLTKLLTKKSKLSVVSDDLSTPTRLSKKSSLLSDDDKKSKRESLAATRAGTQKSSTDNESATKKIKKEKKALSIMGEIQVQKKTNTKVADDTNKEKVQSYMTEEGYSTIMNNKKSRSERQRTRWQLAQDEKFTIGDILTHLINGGFSTQKKAKVPIGSEYQVDVSSIPFKQDTTQRRQLKAKWDPTSYSQSELQNFVKSLNTCLKTKVSQEQAIYVLTRNGNNMKKALNYAKNNKAECLAELAAKTAVNLIP